MYRMVIQEVIKKKLDLYVLIWDCSRDALKIQKGGSSSYHLCGYLKKIRMKKHRPSLERHTRNWQLRLPLGQKLGGQGGREVGIDFSLYSFKLFEFFRSMHYFKVKQKYFFL